MQVETLGAFVKWLEANERKVRRLDRVVLDGVEVTIPSLPDMKVQVLEAENVLSSSLSAIAAGAAARSAALAGVNAFATAGTGTAISTLSGAAAQNAALAYLGGGSIASGGGGMAAGATVLSGVAIAPAVLITGIAVGIEGQKAKTRASKLRPQVNTSRAHMRKAAGMLEAIVERSDELRSVLERLDERTLASLDKLRAVEFDPNSHAQIFLETAQFIRGLSEVLNTPLLDEDGSLSEESVHITERYRDACRTFQKESQRARSTPCKSSPS